MIPKMMEITTKIGCSLNCRFCPQNLLIQSYHSNESNAKMMSFETFRTCIDKIPAEVDIHFSGMSEPWLNPECTKMLLYAYERGHRIHVYTTLVGMTQEDFYRIRQLKFANFVLHIPDKENNSNFVLNDSYMELFNKVVRCSMAGEFQINHFSCHGTVHPQIRELVEASGLRVDSKMYDRAGNVRETCDIDSGDCKNGSVICRFCKGIALDKNVLLPNGQVLLCCMDYGMEFPLGNLILQSFEDISEGRVKAQYRNMMLRDDSVNGILCRFCHRSISIKEPII